MKIAVLCPHFAPDTAPTGEVITRIVTELAALGHELHVVTALPWYREHAVEPGWTGKLVRRERMPWGSITRVHPFPGDDKRNLLRRAVGFAGFSALSGVMSWRGGRVDAGMCNVCHNPGRTTNPLADSSSFIHRIHNGENVATANLFHGIAATFPQDIRKCDNCHGGALQGGQGAHTLLQAHPGIRRVQLVECDLFHSQRFERGLARRPEVLRSGIAFPAPAWAYQTALGRHQHPIPGSRPEAQGLGDQALVVPGVGFIEAVGVGGVDQRHAGIQGGVDHPDPLLLRRTLGDREVHPAIPNNGQDRRARTKRAGEHQPPKMRRRKASTSARTS